MKLLVCTSSWKELWVTYCSTGHSGMSGNWRRKLEDEFVSCGSQEASSPGVNICPEWSDSALNAPKRVLCEIRSLRPRSEVDQETWPRYFRCVKANVSRAPYEGQTTQLTSSDPLQFHNEPNPFHLSAHKLNCPACFSKTWQIWSGVSSGSGSRQTPRPKHSTIDVCTRKYTYGTRRGSVERLSKKMNAEEDGYFSNY